MGLHNSLCRPLPPGLLCPARLVGGSSSLGTLLMLRRLSSGGADPLLARLGPGGEGRWRGLERRAPAGRRREATSGGRERLELLRSSF